MPARHVQGQYAQLLLALLGGCVELLDLLLQRLEGFRLLLGYHGNRVEEDGLGLAVLFQLQQRFRLTVLQDSHRSIPASPATLAYTYTHKNIRIHNTYDTRIHNTQQTQHNTTQHNTYAVDRVAFNAAKLRVRVRLALR